jgi:hypothetical protein
MRLSFQFSVQRWPFMRMTFFKSALPLGVVGLFLAVHVVVPLVWGDVYPFTSAPMFRDKPVRYCNYHVYSPDGTELPQSDWLVQRAYDGNPVGYGVGVTPPAVIEQWFGAIHDEQQVREHIVRHYSEAKNLRWPFVTVEQQVFGPTDDGSIGLQENYLWRITRPSPGG